jgi:aryl-alcohol dehydrogenase-like predicted oxidoreductase
VDDKESMAALHKAVDLGVNFIDTADVYGDGPSERLLRQLRQERPSALGGEEIIIATKAGRRLNPHVAGGYNRQNLTAFVERSLKNLGVESIDLLQLHCPEPEVYYMPETFAVLDDLVQEGKLRYYGVSVEKVEEALKAIEYPNVQTIQIIFNMFRHRPTELFFPEALRRRVGILARVPLASGMLTGKMSPDTFFEASDHRNYNRDGKAMDIGETFSGVNYETGLEAVEELRALLPEGMTMAQFALRWILMFDAVTCVIPGARRPSQAEDNALAADFPPLAEKTMTRIKDIYDRLIRDQVHHYW